MCTTKSGPGNTYYVLLRFASLLQLVCLLSEEEISLAEQIMNNLLGRQVDNNYVVRMYCIRGLGNMADIGGSQVPMLGMNRTYLSCITEVARGGGFTMAATR